MSFNHTPQHVVEEGAPVEAQYPVVSDVENPAPEASAPQFNDGQQHQQPLMMPQEQYYYPQQYGGGFLSGEQQSYMMYPGQFSTEEETTTPKKGCSPLCWILLAIGAVVLVAGTITTIVVVSNKNDGNQYHSPSGNDYDEDDYNSHMREIPWDTPAGSEVHHPAEVGSGDPNLFTTDKVKGMSESSIARYLSDKDATGLEALTLLEQLNLQSGSNGEGGRVLEEIFRESDVRDSASKFAWKGSPFSEEKSASSKESLRTRVTLQLPWFLGDGGYNKLFEMLCPRSRKYDTTYAGCMSSINSDRWVNILLSFSSNWYLENSEKSWTLAQFFEAMIPRGSSGLSIKPESWTFIGQLIGDLSTVAAKGDSSSTRTEHARAALDHYLKPWFHDSVALHLRYPHAKENRHAVDVGLLAWGPDSGPYSKKWFRDDLKMAADDWNKKPSSPPPSSAGGSSSGSSKPKPPPSSSGGSSSSGSSKPSSSGSSSSGSKPNSSSSKGPKPQTVEEDLKKANVSADDLKWGVAAANEIYDAVPPPLADGTPATPTAESKKQFRVLQLKFHPDKNGSRGEAAKIVFQYLQSYESTFKEGKPDQRFDHTWKKNPGF